MQNWEFCTLVYFLQSKVFYSQKESAMSFLKHLLTTRVQYAPTLSSIAEGF